MEMGTSQGGSKKPDRASRRNLNRLCILGACLGVASFFLIWMYVPLTMLEPAPIHPSHTPSIVYMTGLMGERSFVTNLYVVAAFVFLLGTLLAFLFPVGGLLQLASIVMFCYGVVGSGFQTPLDGYSQQQLPREGMLLGIVSCALVLLSVFSSFQGGRLRIGRPSVATLHERLLTFTFVISSS